MNPKQIIENLMKKYHLNFSQTQSAVFINHLESFYQRLTNQESLGFELDEGLKTQISAPIWNQARQLVDEYLLELKVDQTITVDEAEIFLVGTHLSLL